MERVTPILGGFSCYAMADLHLEDSIFTKGNFTTCLVETLIFDERQQQHVVRTAVFGRRIRFRGNLEHKFPVTLIVDAEIGEDAGGLYLKSAPTTAILGRNVIDTCKLTQFIETCSGIGCLGMGLRQAGFDILLKNDVNQKILNLAKRIDNTPLLQGDVGSSKTVVDVCRICPDPINLAAGVSCQPHSKLGDRQGGNDPRSETLPASLRLGFYLRSPVIILECVEEIKSSSWAQSILTKFREQTGYRLSQDILRLQDVWPSRRTRWWAILSHPALGTIPFAMLPKVEPMPMVLHLINEFKEWPADETKQLVLDPYELNAFHHQGISNNIVPRNGQAPTCLHSCGNQMMACPCGCRPTQFSLQRIDRGGLHGMLVQQRGTTKTYMGDLQNMRHVHPSELAILNGLSPSLEWGADLRLALCAIGQLASPIQAAWIGAHVMKHLNDRGFIRQEISPNSVLFKVMQSLIQERDKIFGEPTNVNMEKFRKMIINQTWVMPNPLNETHFQAVELGEEKTTEEIIETEPVWGINEPPEKTPKRGKGIGQKHPTITKDADVEMIQAASVAATVQSAEAFVRKHPSEAPESQKQSSVEEPHSNQTLHSGRDECQPRRTKNREEPNNTQEEAEFDTAILAMLNPDQQVVPCVQNQCRQPLGDAPRPDQTGGVMGFENKRHKTGDNRPKQKSVCLQNQAEKDPCDGSKDNQKEPDREPKTETVKTSNEIRHKTEQQKPGEDIYIGVLTPESTIPLVVKASRQSTGADLAVAEARIGECALPITVRTSIGTVVQDHQVLTQGQTLTIHPPTTAADIECPRRKQSHSKPDIKLPCTRIEALHKQRAWVAKDEMEYYLQVLAQNKAIDQAQIRTFANQDVARQEGAEWLGKLLDKQKEDEKWIVTAAIIDHHWIPIFLHYEEQSTTIITTPDGSALVEHIQTNQKCCIRQKQLPVVFQADCGFQAFAWLAGVVDGNWAFNQAEAMTTQQAEEWRQYFAQSLFQQQKCMEVIHKLSLGGTRNDQDMRQKLKELLKTHGVWEERLEERTQVVWEKISPSTLKSILAAPRAWQDLKAAANQLSPPMQLIRSDELSAQIAARVQTTKHIGRTKTAAGKSRTGQPSLHIVAKDLSIPDGVFKQEDGKILSHLQSQQIGPASCGITILDQVDAEPILRLARPVTHQGLGVLVLATQSNSAEHVGQPIRFPAICNSSQEPVLISGYLYQLGKMQVMRHEPSQKIAVEETPVEAVRCLVYRDQASEIWESMQKQPVKAIFENAELLHPQSGKVKVVDVWDRQWLSKRFEKAKQQAADIFVCSIRIEAEHLEELLTSSSNHGIYFEPRTQCGRHPSPNYHVTWLKQTNFQDAKYSQQTSPQSTTLVRYGDRYGLRSDTMNAGEIHQRFRPDTPLLLGQAKQIYLVGPLPFSTTREAVCKLLKAWKWDARPLQAKGRSADGSGINWAIQAVEEPGHYVYTLAHGDILITKSSENRQQQQDRTYNIVASRKTIHKLQGNEIPDPWTKNDPWGGYTPTSSSTASSSKQPTLTAGQIASVEANIEQRIRASLNTQARDEDVPMDGTNSALEARVATLESQIQQVSVQQQQTDAKIGHFQQQMDHHYTSLNNNIESKFNDQMSRLEALLSKRKHME